MYRNPWISNYLSHVKFCSQGLGSETPAKVSNPRLLQKRALSFQKEFSFDEKDNPAKSATDIDVCIAANLPKVSELRKRFEGVSTSASDWEMNRKERITRRMEGIEGEVHPSLLPSLVSNRLLEEDIPRYTRASDPEPCVVQQCSMEGVETPDMLLKSSDRQLRAQRRPELQSGIQMEPTYSSVTTTAPESKAERIARYKAERRRQLAERYGISLDHEPNLDHSSPYSRARKESDDSGNQIKGESLRDKGMDIVLSAYSSSAFSNQRERARGSAWPETPPSSAYDSRIRTDSLSERERLMNLENQRQFAPTESLSSSSYMDVTSLSSSARVPAKEHTVASVPTNSPKMNRPSSLSSPKHGVTSGDLFIEQQAPNVISRQGSCVSSDFASSEADEEKLDERAKLSVAAKRSLFRELEKSIDGGLPKPRSRNAAVDRRLRRTQDRSRTQPVTTEEVVIAATLQASLQKTSNSRIQAAQEIQQAQDSQETRGSKQVSAMDGKVEKERQEEEEPDLCSLSLAEKMALFNRLAQPPIRVTRTRGDSRQRRANTRYQTQPITLGDMEQLQNGHLHSPSSSSSVRAGGTVSTDHAGDIHITKAQEEPTPPSYDKPLPQKHTADLSAGKRKLPSPERAARQTALPQPFSGRERWREQEEEEREEPQWPAKEEDEGALESLESRKLQEKQEQRSFLREGRHTERHRSRTINGELGESIVVASRETCGSPRSESRPAAPQHPDGPVEPEQGDELNGVLMARHMSIKDRVALLKKSGEEDWRYRIHKKQEVVKAALEEHESQLWEMEQSFKKKVTA